MFTNFRMNSLPLRSGALLPEWPAKAALFAEVVAAAARWVPGRHRLLGIAEPMLIGKGVEVCLIAP